MKTIKQISDNIRLVALPETENYERVYGAIDDPDERESIYRAIDDGGLWYVESQHKCKCCGCWKASDSIGMIIGDPFSEESNPYISSLVASAEKDSEYHTTATN